MSTQPLEQAINVASGVLANVTPEHLSNSTPCESWDVSALINHMVGAQSFFTAAVNEQPPSEDSPDVAAGDFQSAFADASGACVASFQKPGVLGSTVKAPFGEMPGGAFMGLAITDTFQHAWDLAKATGQDTNLAPEMAEMLLTQSKASISENFRGPEGAPFGTEQTCADDACAADHLAAFLGRKV